MNTKSIENRINELDKMVVLKTRRIKIGTNSPFNLGAEFWKRLGAFANKLIQNEKSSSRRQTREK